MTSYIQFYSTKSFDLYEQLFAWISNADEINWTVLEVNNPPFYHSGNLVLYKGKYLLFIDFTIHIFIFFDYLFTQGILFQINEPNKDSSFGFHITLNNSSIAFSNINTYGNQLYPKGQKELWMKNHIKLFYMRHKLLVIPFYSH